MGPIWSFLLQAFSTTSLVFLCSPESFPSMRRIILHLTKLWQDCAVLLQLLLQSLLFPVKTSQINFWTSAHVLSRFPSHHASDSITSLKSLLLEATRQSSGCLTFCPLPNLSAVSTMPSVQYFAWCPRFRSPWVLLRSISISTPWPVEFGFFAAHSLHSSFLSVITSEEASSNPGLIFALRFPPNSKFTYLTSYWAWTAAKVLMFLPWLFLQSFFPLSKWYFCFPSPSSKHFGPGTYPSLFLSIPTFQAATNPVFSLSQCI